MTVLYIFLAIAGIFAILLCSRVGVILSYNTEKETDALGVTVSYLFMRIKLLPNEKKVKLSDYTYKKVQKRKAKALFKEEKKKASKKDEQKEKKPNGKSDKNAKSAAAPTENKKTNVVKLLYDIKDLIFEVIKTFPTKLRLDISRLKLKIGCDDAAKTAITYGAVTEAVGAIITLLESSPIKTKRGYGHEIMVTPDFLSGKIDADVKIKISIAPSAVLGIGLRFVFGFIKYKLSNLKTK